jgi:hypothetical protein
MGYPGHQFNPLVNVVFSLGTITLSVHPFWLSKSFVWRHSPVIVVVLLFHRMVFAPLHMGCNCIFGQSSNDAVDVFLYWWLYVVPMLSIARSLAAPSLCVLSWWSSASTILWCVSGFCFWTALRWRHVVGYLGTSGLVITLLNHWLTSNLGLCFFFLQCICSRSNHGYHKPTMVCGCWFVHLREHMFDICVSNLL